MISPLRRHHHAVLAALLLLMRRNEPLAQGLRDLAHDDPQFAAGCAGLVARLERGEPLAQALVAERLLSRRDADLLGGAPADGLEQVVRRCARDQAGAALLRWYPLWLAAWWTLPCLLLTAVVETVSRHPFPMLHGGTGWLTPALALLAAVTLAFWATVSWLLDQRWLQPLAFLLMPGARRALLARRLLDQAAAEPVTAGWWSGRRLWHLSGLQRCPAASDALAALVADRLLILGEDGRPDWRRSRARVDDEIRLRLGPARAMLHFGLVLSALSGFAAFMQLHGLFQLMPNPLAALTGGTLQAQAMLLAGVALAPILPLLGGSLLGWRWNTAWPQLAEQLATALARREDPLIALGACRPTVPFSLRSRVDAACLELSSGTGRLMEILVRHGLVNPPQQRAALAAEQAGADALIAWLHQEGEAPTAGRAVLAQLQIQLLLCFAVTAYLTAYVLPKFVSMFRALRMTESAPWSLTVLLAIVSSWWPWIALGALAALAVVSFRRGWWPGQRAWRRVQRGELLVRGLAQGRSEADLAAILAWTWRSPPPGLETAGANGDWNRLLGLAGWSGCTTTTLPEAVDRARIRLGRSRARSLAICLVMVPFLTAVPVALTLHSVFASIIALNREMIVLAQREPGGSGRYPGVVIGGLLYTPFLPPQPLVPR